jgi:translocation and assembly module TamB
VSSRLKKWALRSFLTLAVLAVTLGLLLALMVGTESGTRWALARVSTFAPLEIETRGVAGTLLTEFAVPSLRYSDADRIIIIRDVILNIDWSKTSLDLIAAERLTVGEFNLQNSTAKPPGPSPLEISMPAMPVGVRVSDMALDTFIYDDVTVSDISVDAAAVLGRKIESTRAGARVDTISVEVNDLATELAGDVPLRGTIGWRIAGAPWSGRATVSGTLRNLAISHDLAGTYPAHTEGTVQLLQRTEPLVDLVSEIGKWYYQEWTLSDGVVRVIGTASDYRSNISATVAGEEPFSATISGDVAGNTRGLHELDIDIETPIAQARATGSIAWAPQLAINVLLETANLDPSTFIHVATGAINSKVRVTAASAEEFVVEIISLTGIWNEQPANGRGLLSRDTNVWRCAECLFNVGVNRIDIDGRLNDGILAGNIDIDAPSMQQLWPGLAGSLVGEGRVSGSLALPRLSGSMSGKSIGFSDFRFESLDVQSSASTLENIDVAIGMIGLSIGEASLGNGSLRLAGNPSSVALSADWELDKFAATANAQLAVDRDSVSGNVVSASLTEPLSGAWTLSEPVGFELSPGMLNIERGAWLNGDAQLIHQRISVAAGLVSIDAALANSPISALNLLLPEQVRIDGFADATVNLVRRAGVWSGNVDWKQRATSIRFQSDRDDEYLMNVPVASATIRLNNNAVESLALVNAEPGIDISLNASLDDLSSDAALDAHLQLDGDEWDWVPIIFPEIDNVEGVVAADIRAGGIISSPNLSGELRWQNGQLAMPALNLPLSEIDVTLTGTSAGDMTIAGEARSGTGSLSIDGRLEDITSRSPSFTVQLSGDEATLLNWPDYRLTASPDLNFTGNTAGVNVTGMVGLDRAEIAIRELPEGAVSPSDDVAVEGREAVERKRTRISADVELVFSDDIHIQAFGLDTNLDGQLRFVVPENAEPQAHGEVRLVGGVFEAYGQQLTIESGTMIFSGPLDDPIINVRATRKIDTADGTVTAGINLTGRAQNLNSTIFSDPSMPEADAFSYLVLGRPLEDATAEDGNSLSNTAYSLGLRQAALITNQIGQTVGLDELKVSGNNQNTTELVAGKQVSSRLYARYAYGVFTRLGHLLLRYRLSDSFTLEVGAGETQSMDILYTIEKD